ncbi:MAG: response regulator transcription factor [Chloroflexi bacterium]|nr:response regulator transcription factor [Chloroflexota bacterium]
MNQDIIRLSTEPAIHVLLADTHKIIRDGLRHEVGRHDDMGVVAETDDGYEVIRLVDQMHPDVVVLDVNLRHLSGIQVARHINQSSLEGAETTPPRVLAFSSYSDKQYVWAMLAAGVKGYLLKSDPLEKVVFGIRAVDVGQTVLNQQVQNTLLRFIPELHQDLSQSEINVLQLLAHGLSNEQIAASLKITQGTVKNHLHNTYRKIPWVRTRAEAVAWAWINRIVSY